MKHLELIKLLSLTLNFKIQNLTQKQSITFKQSLIWGFGHSVLLKVNNQKKYAGLLKSPPLILLPLLEILSRKIKKRKSGNLGKIEILEELKEPKEQGEGSWLNSKSKMVKNLPKKKNKF